MTTLTYEALAPSPLRRKLGNVEPRLTRITHPTTAAALTAMIVSVAVAGIVVQQLVHTPWGLPGHRGLFWLSTLIAARWTINRPGTALGIGTASSAGILVSGGARWLGCGIRRRSV